MIEELAIAAKSGSGATAIAQKLASAVKEGAPQFKGLVEALNSHLSSEQGLTKETLNTALNDAKNQIKALVQTEFQLSEVQASDIKVEKKGNNVEVTINKPRVTTGTQYHNDTTTINGTLDIFNLVVNLDNHIKGIKDKGDHEQKTIAIKIARRLAKAALKAKASGTGTYNPGFELLKAEFGLQESADVKGGTNTVTVTANAGSENNKHDATVNVTGSEPQGTVTIQVNGAKSVSQAKRIAWKLTMAVITDDVKKNVENNGYTVCQPINISIIVF